MEGKKLKIYLFNKNLFYLNNSVTVCIKTCTGNSEKGICDKYLALKHNNLLENQLTIPKLAFQNLKFTLKFYFETNSLKNICKIKIFVKFDLLLKIMITQIHEFY